MFNPGQPPPLIPRVRTALFLNKHLNYWLCTIRSRIFFLTPPPPHVVSSHHSATKVVNNLSGRHQQPTSILHCGHLWTDRFISYISFRPAVAKPHQHESFVSTKSMIIRLLVWPCHPYPFGFWATKRKWLFVYQVSLVAFNLSQIC